ncbi:MAG: hypothetical protein LBH25_06835 [Fibromonadaceae bacterium]|jgi:hypothetical protein|nr:hypothetical protein [Fibromonadaceae bacterium]
MQARLLFFKIFMGFCFLSVSVNSQENPQVENMATIDSMAVIDSVAVIEDSMAVAETSAVTQPDSSKGSKEKSVIAILYPQVMGNRKIDDAKLLGTQNEMQLLAQKSFSPEEFRFADSSVAGITKQFKGCIKACTAREIKKAGWDIPYTIQSRLRVLGKELIYDVGFYDIDGNPIFAANFTDAGSAKDVPQKLEAFLKNAVAALQKTPKPAPQADATFVPQNFYAQQGDSKSISSGLESNKKQGSSALVIVGVAATILGGSIAAYGLYCEKNAIKWYEENYKNQTGPAAKETWQSIQDAQSVRNIGYGLGGVLFVSGIGMTIFF